MELHAFGEHIIVERVEAENKTSKGVLRTSENKEKPLKVRVYDVTEENSDIKVGDFYLIARYSGIEVEFNKKEYIFVFRKDIMAKVSDDKK